MTINVQTGQMIADLTITVQYIVLLVKKNMEKRILHVMAGMIDYFSVISRYVPQSAYLEMSGPIQPLIVPITCSTVRRWTHIALGLASKRRCMTLLRPRAPSA